MLRLRAPHDKACHGCRHGAGSCELSCGLSCERSCVVHNPATAHGGISYDGPAGPRRAGLRSGHQEKEQPAVNANDVTLTGPATVHTGSMVLGHAPNAPASGSFGLILRRGRRQRPGQPRRALHPDDQRDQPSPRQIRHPAVDAASRWKLTGTGPDYGRSDAPPRR